MIISGQTTRFQQVSAKLAPVFAGFVFLVWALGSLLYGSGLVGAATAASRQIAYFAFLPFAGILAIAAQFWFNRRTVEEPPAMNARSGFGRGGRRMPRCEICPRLQRFTSSPGDRDQPGTGWCSGTAPRLTCPITCQMPRPWRNGHDLMARARGTTPGIDASVALARKSGA